MKVSPPPRAVPAISPGTKESSHVHEHVPPCRRVPGTRAVDVMATTANRHEGLPAGSLGEVLRRRLRLSRERGAEQSGGEHRQRQSAQLDASFDGRRRKLTDKPGAQCRSWNSTWLIVGRLFLTTFHAYVVFGLACFSSVILLERF